MKKRTLLAVFAALTLGVCACGMAACGGTDSSGSSSASGSESGGDSSGTDSSGSSSGGITESEWNEDVLLAAADNFTMQIEQAIDSTVASTVNTSVLAAFDGNKYYEKMEMGGGQGQFVNEMYFEATAEPDASGMVSGNHYSLSGDVWTVSETTLPYKLGLMTYVEAFTYDRFEYDAEGGAYVNRETISVAATPPQEYESVQITFADGAVNIAVSGRTALEASSDGEVVIWGDLEMTIVIDKVGTTEVTLPTEA